MTKRVARFRLAVVIAIVTWMSLGLANHASAGDCGCAQCVAAADCGVAYQLVERTIQVPTTVLERRLIDVIEYRPEVQERQVTVRKLVPETTQVRDVFTVMVPRVVERVVREQVCVPVWREVERDVTVYVPTQEVRRGVRQVCRQVQVEEAREITRDVGQWEEVLIDVPVYGGQSCGTVSDCGRCRRWRGCGGCGGCGADPCGSVGYDAGCAPAITQQVHRVWKPNLVTESVPVVVWKNEIVEEPYEFEVTVCRPVVRRERFKICEMVTQEQQRSVKVAVCVPERREAVRNVTTYRTVMEPRVERCTVKVPHRVQKEISVPVCRLVPRTVTYRIPVQVAAPVGCGACGGVGCGSCGY